MKTIKYILTLPAILITLGIIWESNQPQPIFTIQGLAWQDKLLHFIGYLTYGLSIIIAISVNFPNLPKKRMVLYIMIFGFLFGMTDEIHQYFIPGRTCDFFDWVADATGISLSLIFRNKIKNIIERLMKAKI
jgi:VanZ family protein